MSTNPTTPTSAERQPEHPRITVAMSGLDYIVPDVYDTLTRDGGSGRVILTIGGVSLHANLDVLRRLIVDCDVLLERTAQQRKQAAGS